MGKQTEEESEMMAGNLSEFPVVWDHCLDIVTSYNYSIKLSTM